MKTKGMHTEEARAKAQQTRNISATRINMRRLVKRRREPNEVPTMKYAIQNFCRECLGWDPGESGSVAQAVRDCQVAECWLHPWRDGSLDLTTVDRGSSGAVPSKSEEVS